LQFGVCCAVTPSVAAASTQFRALTRDPSAIASAQMSPAIYHKIVAIGASGAGCRKIVRSTGTLFGRNT
jgi:hypothetical protein